MKNQNITIIRLRNIRKQLDVERFEMFDFKQVCPYTIEGLRKKSNKADIVAWRFVAFTWKMFELKSTSKVGRYFNHGHTTVFHGIEEVELSFTAGGNKRIQDVLKLVVEQENKRIPIEKKIPFNVYFDFLKEYLPTITENEAIDSYDYLPQVILK